MRLCHLKIFNKRKFEKFRMKFDEIFDKVRVHLTLLGHVAGMNNNRRTKKVLNWDPVEGLEGEDRGRTGQRSSSKT